MKLKTKRYPFYIGISAIVVIIVLTLTGLFLWVSYHESKTAAIQMADRLFTEINEKTLERYENALESVAILAGTTARMPGMARIPENDGRTHPGMEMMLEALTFYNYLFSLYTGYKDGSFIQVVAVREKPELCRFYGAPKNTTFVLQSIAVDEEGVKQRNWSFLNKDRQVIGGSVQQDLDFDPRSRPWYIRAQNEETAFYTEPYLFSATRVPGITCAEKLIGGQGVFGADITLEQFSISLEKQKISKNSRLFFFDRAGQIIARSGAHPKNSGSSESLGFLTGETSGIPLIQTVISRFDNDPERMLNFTREVKINGTLYLVRLTGLKPALKFDQILASIAPVSDFTSHIRQMQERTFFFSGLIMAVILPLVLLMSRKISSSLMRLEQESMKIRQFDFSESEPFDSSIKEIHSNITAFILMKTTIRDRTDALIATQKKLETLVQNGIALADERDMDRLLHKIFDSARELSCADGGTLYLRDDTDNLRFEIMQTADGETIRADKSDEAGVFSPIPIRDITDGDQLPGRMESQAALTGKTVVVNQVDDASDFDLLHTDISDEAGRPTCSNYLTAPLLTREGRTIGVLQVFNARDEKTSEITNFNKKTVGFVEALAAQAAVALHNKRLLEEQRILFDAFIQLIAGAIDAKSPYTGGHCARVPKVATMLAEAAHNTGQGPLADFRMETEDQWREFNMAAWLHDCGKVTTPEYVVDKATKMETIYNRIHEIRMRFEVLLRDAEIKTYQKRLKGVEDEQALKAALEKTKKQIKDDFAFIAQCNIGGEFMADEKIDRLNQIATQTWVRHLDDRLGISQDEARLKQQVPVSELPVVEHVLADKPEHIVPRANPDPFDGNPFGFNMVVPENQYNLGELYNLGIRKGTLSPEDRFKINEHIIQTIKMLKKLPFPEYLENVAEIAGAHHETMIGTGYPRGLKKEQMSVPSRIMAIADIFEALTASDRPYKKPKTLSGALRIMSFMRDDQHIDAELFDLFLEKGIYRIYADQFLDPFQIDTVDIRKYLTRS